MTQLQSRGQLEVAVHNDIKKLKSLMNTETFLPQRFRPGNSLFFQPDADIVTGDSI